MPRPSTQPRGLDNPDWRPSLDEPRNRLNLPEQFPTSLDGPCLDAIGGCVINTEKSAADTTYIHLSTHGSRCGQRESVRAVVVATPLAQTGRSSLGSPFSMSRRAFYADAED